MAIVKKIIFIFTLLISFGVKYSCAESQQHFYTHQFFALDILETDLQQKNSTSDFDKPISVKSKKIKTQKRKKRSRGIESSRYIISAVSSFMIHLEEKEFTFTSQVIYISHHFSINEKRGPPQVFLVS